MGTDVNAPSRPPAPGPARGPAPPAAPKFVPPKGEPNDPIRAALVEILRTLNAAEHYNDEREKGLELEELKQSCGEHWAFQKAGVQFPTVIGLLLRNKMIDYIGGTVRSWTRERDFGPHYRINGAGMLFLKEFLDQHQRVHPSTRV